MPVLSITGTSTASRTIERGCRQDGGLPYGRLCDSYQMQDANGTFTFSSTCDCGFDKCNAMEQSALQGLLSLF